MKSPEPTHGVFECVWWGVDIAGVGPESSLFLFELGLGLLDQNALNLVPGSISSLMFNATVVHDVASAATEELGPLYSGLARVWEDIAGLEGKAKIDSRHFGQR